MASSRNSRLICSTPPNPLLLKTLSVSKKLIIYKKLKPHKIMANG